MKTFSFRRLAAAINNRRGVSAVEFALIAPVMITLLLGLTQVTTLVQSRMANVEAAYTMADIVSRCRSVNAGDINDAFVAGALTVSSTKTMPTNISGYISSISYNASTGATTIDWRYNIGSVTTSDSALLTFATGKGSLGSSLIIAGIDYSYQVFGQTIPVQIISESTFLSPRLVKSISFGTACNWTP